jgi:predicted transglutaminase-like cysteine proteinase
MKVLFLHSYIYIYDISMTFPSFPERSGRIAPDSHTCPRSSQPRLQRKNTAASNSTVVLFIGFILAFFLAAAVQAQPRWVRDVISTTVIPKVDREAATLTLLNQIEAEFTDAGKTVIHVRIAEKVLQPAGIDKVRLNEITSEERVVKGLEGWLLSGSNKAVALDDANVVELSTSGIEGSYHAEKILVAGFPNVKVGDIVAYEYEIRDKEPFSTFQRFTLHAQQPACSTRLEVVIPESWTLHASTWRMDIFKVERTENRTTWTAANLPYEAREPLMPSLDYLTRQIQVAVSASVASERTQFTDWNSVTQWCRSMTEGAVTTDPELEALTRTLVKGAATAADSIRAVAKFVAADVRYVAVELEKNRWEAHAAPATFRNRYGDCKDKTALMRAMLRSIGIPSHAVLLNTHIVIDPELPTPFQFNHCIIGIPTRAVHDTADTSAASSASPWVFFDPTDRATPFGSVPDAMQGNSALVIQDTSSGLVRIPTLTPEFNIVRYGGAFVLRDNGSMTGKMAITFLGTAARDERYKHTIIDKQNLADDWSERVKSTIKGATVANVRTVDMKDSLQTSFDVSVENYLSPAGDAYLLKANPFIAADVPPFIKDVRRLPIRFGAPAIHETTVRWTLPQGWKTDEPFTRISSSCRSTSVASAVTATDSTIVYTCIDRQSGDTVPAAEYGAARKYRSNYSTSQNTTLFVRKR